MADTSFVDNALVTKLGSDATLLALCPNGVYWDESPPGSTRFVIVSLVDHHDEPMFRATAYEDVLYQVEARMLSTVPGQDIKAAAARIDALLHYGTLAPTGYTLMTMRRESYIRKTEIDGADPSLRWQRRGGRYAVVVSPV